MWRSLAVVSVLSLLPFLQACEAKPSGKTPVIPEEKKDESAPAQPPTSGPQRTDEPTIENFSYDPVSLLEVGQDSIPVRLHWQTQARSCQLSLGDQLIDVSGLRTALVNIPETMDVRLRCGSVEARVNIPVKKKLSIVSLTVEGSAEGERILWKAFGAQTCQIQDPANSLIVKSQPAEGLLIVTKGVAPLQVGLKCLDAEGRSETVQYNVAEKLKASEVLKIESFTGPEAPLRKLSTMATATALIKWSSNANACQLTYGASTVDAPASGEQTIETDAGEVFLECHGPRFQTARKSLTIETRPALELVTFTAPDGFYGSRVFDSSHVELQVYGADSCEIKADNAAAADATLLSSADELSRRATYRVQVNVNTKSLKLSCRNSLGETLNEVMNVSVLPRITIHKFSVTPNLITSSWSDEAKRPVTLSWDVENMEFCEIKKRSVTDWIPIQRLDPGTSVGELTVEINRATEFRLSCRDTRRLVAFLSAEVKWDRQPEASVLVNGRDLKVKAYGYSSCQVVSQDIGYREKFVADSQLVLSGSRRIPLLMEQTKFELTCMRAGEADTVSSYTFVPKDEYFVLREAEFKAGELLFEAAWKMRADAQECSIYQVKGDQLDLVAVGLALQGVRSFRLPASENDTIHMKLVCGSGADNASRFARLDTPEALCQRHAEFDSIGIYFDLILGLSPQEAAALSCLELVRRLGTVETMNGLYVEQEFFGFAAYMRSVKDLKIYSSQEALSLLYFGKARTLEIYSGVFETTQTEDFTQHALQALSSLESMSLELRMFEGVDLRYIRSSHPKLTTLRIKGFGNSPSYVGTALHNSLRGTKIRTLDIRKLDLAASDLGVLQDLPLKELTIQTVQCFPTMPSDSSFKATNCLKVPAVDNKAMKLNHLGMDFSNAGELEKLVDAANVVSVSYRSRGESDLLWSRSPQVNWSSYSALQILQLENQKSLDSFTPMPQVRTLDLLSSEPKVLMPLQGLKDKFPGVAELKLGNVTVESLFHIWSLPGLTSLSLDKVTIKEWDLPLDGYKLGNLSIRSAMKLKLPRGLEVDRLILHGSDPELEADRVNVLDYRASGKLLGKTLLDAYVGKVKSIILTREQAEPMRAAVLNCEIRRESEVTLLVYPPFDVLWKACEAL